MPASGRAGAAGAALRGAVGAGLEGLKIADMMLPNILMEWAPSRR